MLYNILKPIIRLALRAYFYKIRIIGKSNLIESGPAIYISNHPNAFIDPLILVILMRRKLHFIAGSEWFGKGIKYWVFRNHFNMIPVIRPWLAKNEETDNSEMFVECYKDLSRGRCIVIYPEGSSVTVPWIRDLKTGAARIKLGAEAFDPKLNVPIIPVGLNYTMEHRFQSELMVKIGDPINFSDIYQDPDPDNKEQVRAMTELMQQQLKDQVVHIDQPELKPVVRNVSQLFSTTLIKGYPVNESELLRVFNMKKEIVNAISYFADKDKHMVDAFNERIEKYKEDLAAIRLSDDDLDANVKGNWLMETTGLLVFLPVFLCGIFINSWPYLFVYKYFRATWLPKMMGEYKQGQLNPSFVGSLAFAIGLLVFLIWYSLLIFLSGFFSGIWWLGAPVAVIGYLSGRLSLYYIKWLAAGYKRMKLFWVSITTKKKFTGLKKERSDLIKQLLKFRDQYMDEYSMIRNNL